MSHTPLFRVSNCKNVKSLVGQEDVRDRGSVGAEGDNLTMGSVNTVKANVNNCISAMMYWNVAEWSKDYMSSLVTSGLLSYRLLQP